MPTNNTWNSNIPVQLSKGGTNSVSFSTNPGIVKYDSTNLVTSTTATIDSNNIYTNTSQPRFSAHLSSTVLNVTGDATIYTIICDTEDYDVGNNYNNATGVFTAPKNGVYLFSAGALVVGNTIARYINLSIVTPYSVDTSNQNGRLASTADFGASLSVQIYLTAGQTTYCTIAVTGEAGKTDDLFGSNAANITFFQGCLLT